MNYLGINIKHIVYGKGTVISRSFDDKFKNDEKMYQVFFLDSGSSIDMNIEEEIGNGKAELLLKDRSMQIKIGERPRYDIVFKYVDEYYPSRRFYSHTENEVSELIYNLKYSGGVEKYKARKRIEEILYEIIPDGSEVVLVPASEPGKDNALSGIINSIKSQKQLDIVDCLKRVRTKASYSGGQGRRDPRNDRNTSVVVNKNYIIGKKLILLDDVCTSGSTLRAFSDMLIHAGAKEIECICIGSTVDMNELNRDMMLFTVMQTKGLGKKTMIRILQERTQILDMGLEEASKELETLAKKYTRIIPPSNREFFRYGVEAEKVFELHRKHGVSTISYGSSYYPIEYEQIASPPVILYAKGNLNLLKEKKKVAIIGSRKVTEHGARAAKRLGEVFAEKGYVIVSGLAKGCDENAHQGCLDVNGKTIAILPSPIDDIMPKSNKKLAERIIDCGGLLLSEYPTGQEVNNGFYAERDRLQSGLCEGAIVVETSRDGGTMITANHAVDEGKALACYIHPEKYWKEKSFQGNIELINDNKAMPLRNGDDLLEFEHRMDMVRKRVAVKAKSESTEQMSLL